MRDEVVGGYVLERLLGRGGMGEVWAARSPRGARVALKRLGAVSGTDEGALAEIAAVAALDHPNVMRILDVGIHDGERYLVTNLAAASLADRFPTSWEATRQVLDAVLAALAHTHARGLLHLDVKPENVLREVLTGDRWVLADFGLARYSGTRLERLGGTPSFMAPEQFARGTTIGPAADFYAVGVLAVLLATGLPPFSGSLRELAVAHATAEPPSRPTRFPVPQGFDDWWRALLAKKPGERPALAADVRRTLEALGDGADAVPSSGRPAGDGGRTVRISVERSAPPAPRRVGTFDLDDGLDEPAVEVAERDDDEPLLGETRALPRAVPSCALLDIRQLPLVGREAEIAALGQALAHASAGSVPRWVVLEGPPGIGRRHLARSFAWRAEEAGLAALGRTVPGRPSIALRFGVVGGPVPTGPALVIAVDATPPEPPLLRLALGPLSPLDAARLVRNLAPLDDIAIGLAARGAAGHPGRLVARIRTWAVDGTLVDGPHGLVLDPERSLEVPTGPTDDPLERLAWQVEEDAPAAIPALDAALSHPNFRGNLARARWLVGLAERAVARSGTTDLGLRHRVARARFVVLGGTANVHAAVEAAGPMVETARLLGDPEALADALVLQAHMVQHLGRDPRPLLEEAERVTERPATRGWARAVRGSSLILGMRPAEAVPLLEEAEAMLPTSRELGSTRLWLGSAHQFAGNLAAARAACWRAVETFRAIGHASGEAHALVRIAYATLALADRGEAERILALARDACARAENPMLQTELVAMEGLLLELYGELEAALARFHEALERAVESEAGTSEHDLRIARVLVRLGRRIEAARHMANVGDGAPGVVERAELAAVRVATLPPNDPAFAEALASVSTSWLPEATREMLAVAADDEHLSGPLGAVLRPV